ncbi:hypothetical protein NQ317_015806 [Molorchus minor]|uniref:Integrase catalytic domain-containing protein n=1 Tax=Molorchus minor TaxID=1323400 RepID=A0ABQ9IW83_9CUCU|nr:hypothetical protein NQ317_015806 [Molorchus minor]
MTSPADWRHISGSSNPADLPSRGCTPKQLLESKWWEGPSWLYQSMQYWPMDLTYKWGISRQRKRKKLVASLFSNDITDFCHLSYFSKFSKTTRMASWIFRFIHNTRYPKDKRKGDLTVEEIEQGEIFVFSSIQKEMFSSLEDKRINCLNPYRDTSGLMRLKSRVSNRIDTDSYRFPIIVLPDKHPAIRSLIMDTHRRLCHIGTQGLLAQMREKYWILGGSSVRKLFAVDSPSLPFDRVRDASVFEITGVFAGPLYLKTGEKSVDLSLHVLRRFVARRGRPKIMYSDNGTNFRGTDNAFADLNWEQIMRETSTQRIIWRFNPPSSPWWGGFFERLIGLVKQLLRRLGDVVLIENDSVKRIEWPIGRVVKLLPGKDGCIRLVRVKTVRGELLRPVQRLIPLESDGDFETKRNEVAVMEGSSTASGCKAKDDDVG